jgi:hypothetical protein
MCEIFRSPRSHPLNALAIVDNERMRRCTGLAVFAMSSLVMVAQAHAQAPQPQPQPPPPPPADPPPPPQPPQPLPYAQPQNQPVQVQAPGMQPPPRSVMDKRWAVGLNVGPETMQAQVDGAPKIEFGQFEIAGRFRIRAPMELSLALHLGGTKDIGMGGLMLDFRYRFLAEQKWNVYLLGGLGVIAVAHEKGTEAEKKGRGALRFGAGGERRFGWFALSLELRLFGIGENKDLGPMPVETDAYELSRYKVSGGSLAMGGTVYF